MIRFIKNDGRQQRVVTLPRWALGLGLVAAFLVGILALFLAAGVALIAIPVLLVAGGVAAWIRRGSAIGGQRGIVRRADARRNPFRSDPFRPRDAGEEIVDAEYTIVERDERRSGEPPRDPRR